MSLVEIPETRFAQTDDGMHIAYQVFGGGPIRLAYLPRFVGTIGYMWEIPQYADLLERLGEIATVVALDVRGSGLSDRRLQDIGSALEVRMLDLRAVLDAIGWDRVSLLGCEDGGSLCALFAATYPKRVERLVLFSTYARGSWSEDYPWGWTDDQWEELLGQNDAGWGDPEWMLGQARWLAPSMRGDRTFGLRVNMLYRLGANFETVGDAFDVQRHLDIRDILPTIQAPTIVIYRADNEVESPEQGRYLAELIPDCRCIILPGEDFEIFAGDRQGLIDEIGRFLTGTRPARVADRVLATVLFTDIVDSTKKAAELGDRGWRALLSAHDNAAMSAIEQSGGRYVHTTGDGLLATFDGPARAVRCAQAMAAAVRPLGLEIRAGCHTGEVELVGDDIQGIAVHVGARVASMAGTSEVWVSSTVKDLVAGSGLVFEDTGEHELKGVPDRWRLYRVV